MEINPGCLLVGYSASSASPLPFPSLLLAVSLLFFFFRLSLALLNTVCLLLLGDSFSSGVFFDSLECHIIAMHYTFLYL